MVPPSVVTPRCRYHEASVPRSVVTAMRRYPEASVPRSDVPRNIVPRGFGTTRCRDPGIYNVQRVFHVRDILIFRPVNNCKIVQVRYVSRLSKVIENGRIFVRLNFATSADRNSNEHLLYMYRNDDKFCRHTLLGSNDKKIDEPRWIGGELDRKFVLHGKNCPILKRSIWKVKIKLILEYDWDKKLKKRKTIEIFGAQDRRPFVAE